MRDCGAKYADCGVYAFDNDVVWTGPPKGVRVMRVAAGKPATVIFAAALNPDCSVRGMAGLRVVQAPAHGVMEVVIKEGEPKFPAGSPLAACNSVLVKGVAAIYTLASGFAGADTVAVKETAVDQQTRVFRVELLVDGGEARASQPWQ
jgi:hypothetical protein